MLDPRLPILITSKPRHAPYFTIAELCETFYRREIKEGGARLTVKRTKEGVP